MPKQEQQTRRSLTPWLVPMRPTPRWRQPRQSPQLRAHPTPSATTARGQGAQQRTSKHHRLRCHSIPHGESHDGSAQRPPVPRPTAQRRPPVPPPARPQSAPTPVGAPSDRDEGGSRPPPRVRRAVEATGNRRRSKPAEGTQAAGALWASPSLQGQDRTAAHSMPPWPSTPSFGSISRHGMCEGVVLLHQRNRHLARRLLHSPLVAAALAVGRCLQSAQPTQRQTPLYASW